MCRSHEQSADLSRCTFYYKNHSQLTPTTSLPQTPSQSTLLPSIRIPLFYQFPMDDNSFKYYLRVLSGTLIIIRFFNSMLHPTTKWAQRKDRVFVELHLMDIVNEKVDLTATHLNFQGESGGKKYAFQLELFAQVVAEESKWTKTGFHLLFALTKKDVNAAFWPRLIKSTQKSQYIQVDWAKWVDEDQEEEDPNKGLGGFDPSQMQNFGGAPDEDDEEGNLDDLDKEEELQEKKE